MSVIPEQNGADFWLEEYGCYIHCDVYLMGKMGGLPALVLRTNPNRIYGPPPTGREHGVVHKIMHWFDETQSFGTLLASYYAYTYHGRDGIEPRIR